MLKPIVEVARLASASPEPHGVAILGNDVWISSRATRRIDVMQREGWNKVGEVEPPGMPWGMNFGGGAVLMTCGEGDDDHRFIHRFVPDEGYDERVIACPEDTGSHLAFYDGRVLLGQFHNKRLLLLDEDGSIARTWSTPREICGVAVIDDVAFLVSTDYEAAEVYWFTRLDLRSGNADDLATIPFRARGLAWDGSKFWTNHRKADRTVVFTLPS
jgi:hypothetical protein